jgi:hypothetical protein
MLINKRNNECGVLYNLCSKGIRKSSRSNNYFSIYSKKKIKNEREDNDCLVLPLDFHFSDDNF